VFEKEVGPHLFPEKIRGIMGSLVVISLDSRKKTTSPDDHLDSFLLG